MPDAPATEPRVTLAPDRWLEGIFGCPAFRVSPAADGSDTLDALPRGPLFAYAKLPAEQVAMIAQLTRRGFRLVDTAVTLDKPAVAKPAAARGVRFARADDEDAVAGLAATAFRFNRFRADPAVSEVIAQKIKESWARSFFAGRRGSHLLVAERGGRFAGFNLLIAGPREVVIDLIAVAPDYQGQGIGADLIAFAEAEVADGRRMVVGTQLANTPSLRLYTRLGFRPFKAEHVLHLTRELHP